MNPKHIFSKQNRALLAELVRTDFKLRYQGSALGYAWSLLKPLFLFAVMYMVFVQFLKFGSDTEYFPISLLLGIVLWGFFSEIVNQGMVSIVSRGDLLRKIKFPKSILVFSGTISALINLFFNLTVVVIFMVFSGVSFKWSTLMLPVNILEIYIFAVALAFFLAAVYVKLRDISHIWEIIMQAAFYATPIIYPLSYVVDKSEIAAKIIMLNPLAQAIQEARYNLVTHQTETAGSLMSDSIMPVIPVLLVAATVVLAFWYFKKESKNFAENV